MLIAAPLLLTPLFALILCEAGFNPHMMKISPADLARNYLIWFIIGLFFRLLTPFPAVGIALTLILGFAFGCGNHFIILFRRTPVTPADLLSLGTAAAVANSYDITLPPRVIGTLAGTILLAAGGIFLNVKGFLPILAANPLLRLLLAALLLIAVITAIRELDLNKIFGITPKPYRVVSMSYEHGAMLMFLLELKKLFIKKPDGYHRFKAKVRLRHLKEEAYDPENETPKAPTEKPAILTVMNESFSDMAALGPFPSTGQHIAFYRSMKNDPGTIAYGWDYVSTRGGGTARTEFEYLTGNSMVFVPGSIPYIQYDFADHPAMPQELAMQGYRSIAMHPELRTNWHRDKVYAAMGFDEFIDRSGFPEAREMVFGHTDDQSCYEEVLRVLDKNEDPVFIFNVTMQNHGGYDIEAFREAGREIVSIDPEFEEFTDVSAFETLMKASDDALHYLVDELRSRTRPVILTFFGDHQPALDGDFEMILERRGKIAGTPDSPALGEKYFKVPYFIWTNRPDLFGTHRGEDEPEDATSPNFLGMETLTAAKLEFSGMDLYLTQLKERIPVMNETGFLGDDGDWHTYDEPGEYEDDLNEYRRIQWYRMFDKK